MAINIKTVRDKKFPAGQYVGIVTDNTDSIYTGRVSVRFGEFGSLSDSEVDHICLLCTPYGGVTSTTAESVTGDEKEYGKDGTSESGTPKSYGMWPQPPTIGTSVLVAFVDLLDQGIIVGSLMSRNRNHMMGGRASAESQDGTIQPVGEKNPTDTDDEIKKPVDPIAKSWLKEQGLQDDYSRGHSLSSARRESPSHVFGLTTLNGHVFTMDDGDQNGDSKNVRLRTRGGAQILLDDTNKFVFITNHNGNAWIEMDEAGNIDVYSKKSVNIHSEEDLNFHADGNINMEAKKNINMKSDIMSLETKSDYYLKSGSDVIIQALNDIHNKSGSNHIETAPKIYMNSSTTAAAAPKPKVNELIQNETVKESVSARVPEHHPWKGASKIQETIKTAKGKT
jgi:hypothetical protein|tara:strand:- start:10676 stop:11857 length:1182 start_codon:yes stop_codon:yes gene_type:complete